MIDRQHHLRRNLSQFRILLLALLSLLPLPAHAQAATGTLLDGGTLYPRLVRLSHGPAATNGRLVASTNGILFQSTDNGRTWTSLGAVAPAPGSTERCCATLYEVPRTVGSLAAGTLISAGSYLAGDTPAIEVYTSKDAGRTWAFHSTPIKRGDREHGLWEPEFTVSDDGALVMFWSDETDSCCSQKLMQIRSRDGRTWGDPTDTVRSSRRPDRPGMIVASKLPDSHFFLSYEICGPAYTCTVFTRTSPDGWHFGKPTDMGTRVQTTTGRFLKHAPTNIWFPSPGSPNGTVLLAGQVLYEADGTVSPANGTLLLTTTDPEGAGPWQTLPAPVQVPNAYDNYCPNYSSALLPSPDGATLLELASAYSPTHTCQTYFATTPLTPPQPTKAPITEN